MEAKLEFMARMEGAVDRLVILGRLEVWLLLVAPLEVAEDMMKAV